MKKEKKIMMQNFIIWNMGWFVVMPFIYEDTWGREQVSYLWFQGTHGRGNKYNGGGGFRGCPGEGSRHDEGGSFRHNSPFLCLQEPRELGWGCPLTYPFQSYSTSSFLFFPKASKKVSASGDLETRISLPETGNPSPREDSPKRLH